MVNFFLDEFRTSPYIFLFLRVPGKDFFCSLKYYPHATHNSNTFRITSVMKQSTYR